MSETASATAAGTQAASKSDERSKPAWAAVVSLSFCVFGLVTAEFLPASLLTPIAADLGVTDGAAGQAVTATAIVAAVAALTMAIVTRGLDRRLIMWTFALLLVLSNLLARFATDLAMLVIARVLLGIALGGFWSMSAAMAMRLVPMRLMPRAMSLILTGVSIATVSAAPLGAYIGSIWGWRAVFLIAAAAGVVALLAQMLTLPRLPPTGAPGFGTLLCLLRRRSIRIGLVAALLVNSGHFAGFTYVRPFLERVPVLDVEAVSLVLLAYGIGGFFGNFAGAFAVERSVRGAIALGSLLIGVTTLVLVAMGESASVAAVAVAVWGFAFGALPVGFQTWTVRSAPDQAEGAGGLMIATFQIGIAGGAVLGGVLVDQFDAMSAIAYCAFATVLAAVLIGALGGHRAGYGQIRLPR